MHDEPARRTVVESTSETVRILTLDRPPVNAIDLDLLGELDRALERAAREEELSGLVLTGRTGVFSAGLDLPTLLTYGRDDIARFWALLHRVLVRLIRHPRPVLVAVNGHCPAGGTVLALPADQRFFLAGPYRIGLNEVEVGLAVPPFIVALFQYAVGVRRAGALLIEGRLLDPAEALAAGLVDEVVAPELWEERLACWRATAARLRGPAREATRQAARAELLDLACEAEKADLGPLTDFWFAPATRRSLEAFVARLKARKAPAE
jgi:3,2-trans-enoyl-CoA isomerase